jgi:hypothetical protein
LHGKIARVIDERFPTIKTTEPEVLAHHLTAAGLIHFACPRSFSSARRCRCAFPLAVCDDIVTDSSEIFCSNCGESAGTYRELRNAAMEAVRKRAIDIVKNNVKIR